MGHRLIKTIDNFYECGLVAEYDNAVPGARYDLGVLDVAMLKHNDVIYRAFVIEGGNGKPPVYSREEFKLLGMDVRWVIGSMQSHLQDALDAILWLVQQIVGPLAGTRCSFGSGLRNTGLIYNFHLFLGLCFRLAFFVNAELPLQPLRVG